MSLRTPLARVRGLGAAKEGTEHWWAQRLTALALVPLCFVFVAVVVAMIGADHAQAAAVIGNPWIAVVMLLFLIAGFWHMKLGVQVVIEDYVHHEAAKTASLVVLTLATVALATASAFAVIKLAVAG